MSCVFLQLEAEPNCSFDYVDVFGGLEDYDGDLYGRYCGTIVSIYHIHTYPYVNTFQYTQSYSDRH